MCSRLRARSPVLCAPCTILLQPTFVRPRLRWAALLLTCKRIRRWARRLAAVNTAAALWTDYRPYQQRDVTFHGRVQNATGASCETAHHRNYNVFFDIFPRRQDRLYPDPAEVRGM